MNLNKIYSKVFGWMFLGLLVTFITGYIIANNINMLLFVLKIPFIIYIILELGLVIFLSARIHKMSDTTAKICFLIYSFVTGLTFSTIFVIYELTSIIYVFGITALLFGIFAIFGHFTKLDLTKISTFLLMGLLGVIICSIINMFLGNSTFDLIITIISIIIFLAYTAYDMQKIKRSINILPEENLAVISALELYLDFINLFLDLLRLFGKSKN